MQGSIFNDPYDAAPEVQPLVDGSSLIDSLTLIEEINGHIDLDLGDPGNDTIAGQLVGRIGRMEEIGGSINLDSAVVQVEAMNGRRITQLSLAPLSNLVHEEGPSPTEGADRS